MRDEQISEQLEGGGVSEQHIPGRRWKLVKTISGYSGMHYFDSDGQPSTSPAEIGVEFVWANDYDALKAQNAGLVEASKHSWVICNDRMPDRDGWYLVASSDWRNPRVYVLECRDTAYPERAHWCVNGDWHGSVTHWQPLPNHPRST